MNTVVADVWHCSSVIVLRALARVEPAMALAQAVRAAWRGVAWQLEPTAPRVWRT